ncbi:squalene synthase HpnC [Frankia sp. AgPm24]|uniref:squalene synthase HpnC n=1 Tax=Frankia sp. AgPm24 TaxID=631128 RepID=UPI00200F03F2|nr:squalene synthase HpnC [Frankia sp. AgPm24]MCK9924263.1 squalene synthase HpnC [Frankia sp. AgPm24]
MTAIDAPTGPPRTAAPPRTTGLTTSADQLLLAAPAENFPVAPIVLPPAVRTHFNALYAYCRFVDNLGDEADGDRLALLDRLDVDLAVIWAGGEPELPVLRRLAPTVRACDLPAEPFERLVEANRQDQLVTRYETFDDLVRYCTLSADPVGRMVLGVFGLATPDRVVLSDRVCTALQLVEHWQDVAEDLAAGRIYLPLEDLDAFGVTEDDLRAPSAGPAVRHLMAFEVTRARAVIDAGAPLVSMVPGRLRLALAGFVGGGRSALDAIRRADYDVLSGTPKAAKPRMAGAIALALARSAARGSGAAASTAAAVASATSAGGLPARPPVTGGSVVGSAVAGRSGVAGGGR